MPRLRGLVQRHRPRIYGEFTGKQVIAHRLRRAGAPTSSIRSPFPTSVLRRRPHEFSGGQLQRIAIARALMPSPKVLVADEPVSALDVSIQAQVLNVMRDLVTDLGLALVLVTHDLAVVASVATHALVFADGRVVEEGHPHNLVTDLQQPATKNLVDAVLTLGDGLAGKGLA